MAGLGDEVVRNPLAAKDGYDFTTGEVTGRRPEKGRLAMMARPYLVGIHPDRGYSSLSLCAFEYLGGVLDGVNSEGLAVSILAEEESLEEVGREPGNEVGMHELMAMRYLLDNCKNVEEAKEALLSMLGESIGSNGRFRLEEIAAINARVAAPPNVPGNPETAPGRTLWYAQYDLEDLTLTVKFYLGEKSDPENEKTATLEYSAPQVYRLDK